MYHLKTRVAYKTTFFSSHQIKLLVLHLKRIYILFQAVLKESAGWIKKKFTLSDSTTLNIVRFPSQCILPNHVIIFKYVTQVSTGFVRKEKCKNSASVLCICFQSTTVYNQF